MLVCCWEVTLPIDWAYRNSIGLPGVAGSSQERQIIPNWLFCLALLGCPGINSFDDRFEGLSLLLTQLEVLLVVKPVWVNLGGRGQVLEDLHLFFECCLRCCSWWFYWWFCFVLGLCSKWIHPFKHLPETAAASLPLATTLSKLKTKFKSYSNLSLKARTLDMLPLFASHISYPTAMCNG